MPELLTRETARERAKAILVSGVQFRRHWIPESLEELADLVAKDYLLVQAEALEWAGINRPGECPCGNCIRLRCRAEDARLRGEAE